MLGVTLSRDARARAVQLPAWNEALGLPRPWDQQWSLRMQQVLAFESDLLEYDDIFAGSHVMEALTQEIADGARKELGTILDLGGVVAAVESGYLKSALVGSLVERRRRIENGDDVVVGVNRFAESEPSPLVDAGAAPVERIDPAVEAEAAGALRHWRAGRDAAAVEAALERLRAEAADPSVNLMDATLACVRAGVTTGEWAGTLRQVVGEYRPPTGLDGVGASAAGSHGLAAVRQRAQETAAALGRSRLRMLVGKPGLDGHSNGAEQIAVRARDAGFEVV
jgi:(2R)-ethylmalonyl-CoA mutase